MTPAVVGVYLHPKACPVCGGDEQVGFSPVGPVNVGGRHGGPHLRFEASRLAAVIPCLQCRGGDLTRLFPVCSEPTTGGAA